MPSAFCWHGRAVSTVKTLVPWLIEQAPALRDYVQQVLNSPRFLRDAWAELRTQIDAPSGVARLDQLLEYEEVLVTDISGDKVSAAVTKHLIAQYPGAGLVANSKSDYPDVFLLACDYSNLPVRIQTKKKADGDKQEIGAAVRGDNRRPVRVPDGLEIKISRDNKRIDCHYSHPGLHLLVSFVTKRGPPVVDDVLAAFLRKADYHESGRNTEATTVKHSFSRASFVSLLPAKRAE